MDSSGYKIDIPESFAPEGPMTIIGKLITTGMALATLFVALLETPSVRFFFAYFTSVSLVLTIIYLLFSFVNTVFPARIQQPSEDVVGRAKWTWIFFVAGVHGQVRLYAGLRRLRRVAFSPMCSSLFSSNLTIPFLLSSRSSWRPYYGG